jgi:hypothetical protein
MSLHNVAYPTTLSPLPTLTGVEADEDDDNELYHPNDDNDDDNSTNDDDYNNGDKNHAGNNLINTQS